MKIPERGFGGFVPIIVLALLAIIIGAVATRWGIGVISDSTNYLNLRPDPDPGHGPLLRWIHAAIGSLGFGVVETSRWFFILLLAANIVLFWYAMYIATYSTVGAFIGAWLLLTAVPFLQLHTTVLSEPLYFLLGFSGLLALARYFDTRKLNFLVMSGLFMALASLCRYPGVAFVATGSVGILLFGSQKRYERLFYSTVFGILAVSPLVSHLAYNTMVRGTATDRATRLVGALDMEVFIGSAEKLMAYIYVAELPFFHIGIPIWIGWLAMILVTIGLTILFSVHLRSPTPIDKLPDKGNRYSEAWTMRVLPQLLVVHLFFYLIIYFTAFLIDKTAGPAATYIVPVYITVVLLGVILVNRVLRPLQNLRIVYTFVVALAVGMALFNSARATKWTYRAHENGMGYASKKWRQSELIAYVQHLEPSVRIYCNTRNPLLLLTRKEAPLLPAKWRARTGETNPLYQNELETMKKDLQSNQAVVLYFKYVERPFLVSEQEVVDHMGLEVLASFADGIVYAPKVRLETAKNM